MGRLRAQFGANEEGRSSAEGGLPNMQSIRWRVRVHKGRMFVCKSLVFSICDMQHFVNVASGVAKVRSADVPQEF